MATIGSLFGRGAHVYEQLFSERRIDDEAGFLDRIFSRYGVRSVLDIACGHIPHGRCLARLGYAVSGLDISGSLLKLARMRADAEGLRIKLYRRDMRHFSVGEFDAAYVMFSSILHLHRHEDLLAHFRSVSRNLREGGLYIVDLTRAPFANPLKAKRTVRRAKNIRYILEYRPVDARRLIGEFTLQSFAGEEEYRDRFKVLMFMPLVLLNCYADLAGFIIIDTFADFQGHRKLTDNKTTYVAVLKKKGRLSRTRAPTKKRVQRAAMDSGQVLHNG